MGFYDEKENLLNAESDMNSVTARFNEQLKQFDTQTLNITYELYYFRKFKVENKDNNEQDFKEKCSKEIKDRFNINCSPENVDSFIATFSKKAKPVLDFIENYKKELLNTYMKYSSVLRCAISDGSVDKIEAVHDRANQFENEMVNGIFASSGFSDLENYIGRAATIGKGMTVNNSVVVYPDSPFKDIEEQQDSQNLLLQKNVYVYSMDACKFEPVIDFGMGRDGRYNLQFGQEWISRNESLECEQEIIDRVPRDILERKQIFYRKQRIPDEKIDFHSKREFLDKYSKLVVNGELGFANDEMRSISIEETLEDEELYLHWTNKKNLLGIQIDGLIADIGENSRQGSETTQKVFFARGIAGEVGILNRYLNLLSSRFDDRAELYENFKNIIGNLKFLKLKLSHTDKSTYEKMTPEEQKNIDYLEDDINEETGEKMTSRNMHMIVGKNLDPSKIQRIDGDPFELIKVILEQYKQKFPNKDYLNNSIDQDYLSGFVDYVSREREKNENSRIKQEQSVLSSTKDAFVENTGTDEINAETRKINLRQQQRLHPEIENDSKNIDE